VERSFRPEFVNRLDRVLVFDPLPAAAVARVLDRELEALARRPGLAHAPLQLSDEARAHLARAGHHPRWGARELLRVLHHEVAAPLARALDEWPEPTPPRLRVDATPEGLRVKASAGDRGARDDLGDADHLRATAARSRLAAVARGGAVAELAARIQDDDRRAARGERVPTTTHRELLADLRAALDDARTLERRAGRAALRGRQEPGVPDAQDALDRRSLQLARALVEQTEPTTSTCVVAVYGRHHVGPLARLFHTTAEAHGLRATPARVWLRAVKVKEGAFWVEGTRGDRPELGVEIGVELLLEGPAAALLFAQEDHLWQVGALDTMRARVVSAAGGRADWDERRPSEPHRRSFYTGTPGRTLRVDRAAPDAGPAWAGDVAAAFEAAVFAALA
jgi:ATP-dependent Clp protease ATP-binding subunit ClpC